MLGSVRPSPAIDVWSLESAHDADARTSLQLAVQPATQLLAQAATITRRTCRLSISKQGCIPMRTAARPNPSLERTATGLALGPRGSEV